MVLCVKRGVFNTAINIEMSPGVIYSKTLGSPRGGARLMGPHGRLGGGGKPGPLLENEGGWSIPEAAGARGCLLGCAGPTRGSFRAATPAGGEEEKEWGHEGEGGELSQTLWGLLQTLEGRAQAGRRPLEVGPHPPWTQVLPDFLGGDTPRQVGDRSWLEREKCPEKRTVPVGSGDVCSTVHGSYQLSTDPPTPPTTASHPAQPQPRTCM